VSENSEHEELTYIISHDFQEPIRMIGSYVKLLEKKYGEVLDDEAKDYIHYAVDGVNKLRSMLDDLLKYSRLHKNKTSHAEFSTIESVKSALNQLSLRYKEGNFSVIYDEKKLPVIKADKNQVSQLFLNIIDNSLKFNLETEKKVYINTELTNEGILFSISDNGIGIDSQYHEKVFRIFQKLHSQTDYPGSGIGLAICKRVIDNHDGRIWIESEEGKGTKFCFVLPN
jgi:light-regulated signal transduction histidine kinase (bacteriophytochrome)